MTTTNGLAENGKEVRMFTIKTYNHETRIATTNALEAAINRAEECTKKDAVCLVYDDGKLIGVGSNGEYHKIAE